jgi:hypothetical protein
MHGAIEIVEVLVPKQTVIDQIELSSAIMKAEKKLD